MFCSTLHVCSCCERIKIIDTKKTTILNMYENCAQCKDCWSKNKKSDQQDFLCENVKSREVQRFSLPLRKGGSIIPKMSHYKGAVVVFSVVLMFFVVTASAQFGKFADIQVRLVKNRSLLNFFEIDNYFITRFKCLEAEDREFYLIFCLF